MASGAAARMLFLALKVASSPSATASAGNGLVGGVTGAARGHLPRPHWRLRLDLLPSVIHLRMITAPG